MALLIARDHRRRLRHPAVGARRHARALGESSGVLRAPRARHGPARCYDEPGDGGPWRRSRVAFSARLAGSRSGIAPSTSVIRAWSPGDHAGGAAARALARPHIRIVVSCLLPHRSLVHEVLPYARAARRQHSPPRARVSFVGVLALIVAAAAGCGLSRAGLVTGGTGGRKKKKGGVGSAGGSGGEGGSSAGIALTASSAIAVGAAHSCRASSTAPWRAGRRRRARSQLGDGVSGKGYQRALPRLRRRAYSASGAPAQAATPPAPTSPAAAWMCWG